MICPDCGSFIDEGEMYCPHCGYRPYYYYNDGDDHEE